MTNAESNALLDTTYWFGAAWDAPVCRLSARTEVPLGAKCLECEEHIAADDQGFLFDNQALAADAPPGTFPLHLKCLRSTFGNPPHHKREGANWS